VGAGGPTALFPRVTEGDTCPFFEMMFRTW